MKRSAFKPAGYVTKPATQSTYTPKPRAMAVARADGKAHMVVTVPKAKPVRHEGYRRLVAALPCIVCGLPGHSQAAHPNTSKGAMLKTDDRLCFPLCADAPLVPGCHTQFDQGAAYPKAARRRVEPIWGRHTRQTIAATGQWPADLAPWPGDQVQAP